MVKKPLEEALVILKNNPEKFKKKKKKNVSKKLVEKPLRKFDLIQHFTYSVMIIFLLLQFFLAYFFR